MDLVNIKNLDLNLLRTFVVLMEERNVSRASERLNITQSAASNALERIRESFQDRILEREGRVMQPTRAAEYLLPRISAALSDIESALGSYASFDPLQLSEQFSIGIDEYSMALFGDALTASVFKAAPGVTLAFHGADPARYSEQLSRGELDLLVAPVWQSLPDLVRQPLYQERFVGLMSEHHPLAGKRMTLKRYVSYPHLLVSTRGIVQGNVDVGLRNRDVSRRVAMSTPWLESAPTLLSGSDMLLNVGHRLSGRFVSQHPVITFDIPVDVPGFNVCLLWHPRNTGDAHHRWLRSQFLAGPPGSGFSAESG